MFYRPQGPRIVAVAVAVVLVVMTVLIGVALPSYVEWTAGQLFTLALIAGVIFAGLYAVARSSVDIRDDAIEIVNGYKRHVITWDRVRGISMRQGAPWPTLVVDDDERVMIFAIQRTDSGLAGAAVQAIREKIR